MPIPDPTAQEIQRVGQYIENKVPGSDGVALASRWETYAADHPNETVGNRMWGWLKKELGVAGIAKVPGILTGAVGKAADQIAKGTVQGLDKTGQNPIDRALGWIEQQLINLGKAVTSPSSIADFLGRLTEASTWERVGTVVIGVVLLAVGLARITGTQNAVSSIVKARIP